MDKFTDVEDTLFVPMLGRIYASENFPEILNDKKALELKDKLPKNIKGKDTQTQYTLLAGAIRAANMDRYVKEFINKNPNGIIVELGCGLETGFYRNNSENKWYEIDLPNVVNFRNKLLGENDLDKSIACSAFEEDWIKEIRNENKEEPILILAGGFFYFFEEEKISELLNMLKKYGNIEVVFDIVNSQGMKRISKYMKQVGHENTKMFFCVDYAKKMAEKMNVYLIKEEAYYRYNSKKCINLITALTMKISDIFKMVKMIHIRVN